MAQESNDQRGAAHLPFLKIQKKKNPLMIWEAPILARMMVIRRASGHQKGQVKRQVSLLSPPSPKLMT